MKVGVIGGGSWGTALARLLADNGNDVVLWFRRAELAEAAATQRENPTYLPGFAFPAALHATADMEEAVAGTGALIAACPSHAMREVFARVAPHIDTQPLIISASKGIESGSSKRMTEVLVDTLGEARRQHTGVLSGPSFAREVAAGMPTAVTVAAPDEFAAAAMQQLFSAPLFRVYSSTDIIGVELSGAVKNVIAIAAGVCDGLGFGHSTRAALITRGAAETARLVAQAGGDAQTASGLSGVGDLVLTCTGDLSRNRTVGIRLGKGEVLADILADIKMVAEGVKNSKTICTLAEKLEVEMPICEQVQLLLHEDKPAEQVVRDLLSRANKPEFGK
jgi:glycerol-3-phosphate dehydrogenase (NAD(P)+)